MSSKASPLPAGWINVLGEIQMRLDQAIASTNARMAGLPNSQTADFAHTRQQEAARWHERLRRLSAYLESAEQVVQSVDEMLEREETGWREHLAKCGTLRQELAKGAGGAIGYKA